MRAVLLGLGLALASPASAAGVSNGDVRVVCPMTVGGSFEARTTALSGSLAASGPNEITVDLRNLDTGIALRNDHLRESYLEVGKGDGFDTAVLSEIAIAAADPAAFQGRTTFTGTLRLHGVSKPVTGSVELRRQGGALRVAASFPVRLADFGIAEPRYLGVGVKDEVRVNVTLAVAVEGAR